MPPVRLRMRSFDALTWRSMEVEWENGTGIRQTWSSWSDAVENGWYEAVKLLPASVTDIRVSFQVHGLGGPFNVARVDRSNGCCWVDGAAPEAIWFRAGTDNIFDEIDAVFELRGCFPKNYVSRAWNSANSSETREIWERWDGDERPLLEPRPPILKVIDAAESPRAGRGSPEAYLDATSKRLYAGALELKEVHQRTIKGLQSLDESFTAQWWSVNSGNTVSAGLGIGAAVTLFFLPPVGIGLGIGSAVAGIGTTTADIVVERSSMADLREHFSKDTLTSFIVAELFREWTQAKDQAGQASQAAHSVSTTEFSEEAGISGARALHANAAVVNAAVAKVGVEAVEGSMASARAGAAAAESAQVVASTAAAASKVIGIAGAVLSTGIAIHGWSTTKLGQSMIRAKIEELSNRVLCIQVLLAYGGRLECSICLDSVSPMDRMRRCARNFHIFHLRCLQTWERADANQPCPNCMGLDGFIDLGEDTIEQLVSQLGVVSA